MTGGVRWMYSGIRVRDLTRSVRFYRRLGFRVVKRGGFSHGGRWVHLVFPGSTHRLELNYYAPGSHFAVPFRPGEEFDHFGFYVDDPLGWVRKAVRSGATPMVGFVDGPAQLMYVRDPDGNWLGACGPSEPLQGPKRRGRAHRGPARPRTAD